MVKKPYFEDEINFMNVIKDPIRWFGIIYPYFLVIILAGGIFYYQNMTNTYRNDITPSITDSANVFVDVRSVVGSVSQGIDVKLLLNPGQVLIQKGTELYKANCVSCHGEQGLGDGPAGQVLNPQPRNFHQKDGWKNGREFSGMFKTVTEGLLNSGMPSYSYLSAEDRAALVSYVRTFAKDFPQVTNQELSQLDRTYKLTEGSVTPSQIPVESAITKITEESLPQAREIYSIISQINKFPDLPGAQILNKVSGDKVRIVSFFRSSNKWSEDLDNFIKTVISTMNSNGFNAGVIKLKREEWDQLFNYMISLYTNRKT